LSLRDPEGLKRLEDEGRLWDARFLGYPVWATCRHDLYEIHKSPRPRIGFTLPRLTKSVLDTARIAFGRRKPALFIASDRPDMVKFEEYISSEDHWTVLTYETGVPVGFRHASSLALVALRVLCRVAVLLLPDRAAKLVRALAEGGAQAPMGSIRVAMGDALFCKALDALILRRFERVYYSVCLMPVGAKFMRGIGRRLIEVQHGVLSPSHQLIFNIPPTEQTLALYSERYMDLVKALGYPGKLALMPYKRPRASNPQPKRYGTVVFTQPDLRVQREVDEALRSGNGFLVQRHPRDYYPYACGEGRFVTVRDGDYVERPILFWSTLIEEFTELGWDVRVIGSENENYFGYDYSKIRLYATLQAALS
jgi:hypothetical protein